MEQLHAQRYQLLHHNARARWRRQCKRPKIWFSTTRLKFCESTTNARQIFQCCFSIRCDLIELVLFGRRTDDLCTTTTPIFPGSLRQTLIKSAANCKRSWSASPVESVWQWCCAIANFIIVYKYIWWTGCGWLSVCCMRITVCTRGDRRLKCLLCTANAPLAQSLWACYAHLTVRLIPLRQKSGMGRHVHGGAARCETQLR